MKVLVMYNPSAGKHKHNDLVKMIEGGFARYDMVPDCVDMMQVQDIAHHPLSSYDLVVAAGGDGTVHSVISTMLQQGVDVPLAIIPLGSANLLASYLGVPTSVSKAVDVALSYPAHAFDVAVVNNTHYCITAMGIGYDALVVNAARQELKRWAGWWAYALGMVQGLFHWKESNFSITVDGTRVTRHAKTLFIMNIGRFFQLDFGNGIRPDDGVFDVAIVRPVSLLDVVRLFLLLVSKKYYVQGRLEYVRGKRIEVRYNDAMPVQVDGESLTLHSPLEIKVLKSRIRIHGKGS